MKKNIVDITRSRQKKQFRFGKTGEKNTLKIKIKERKNNQHRQKKTRLLFLRDLRRKIENRTLALFDCCGLVCSFSSTMFWYFYDLKVLTDQTTTNKIQINHNNRN